MIHRVYSDLPSFKEIWFKPNVNVLLADQSEDSSEFQTRNGSGKSSLIELIHFLLGADNKSLFRNEKLKTYYFGLDFELSGKRTVVERRGDQANRIIVKRADESEWPVAPSTDRKSGKRYISNSDWRTVLGNLMFGIATKEDGGDVPRFSPTFRMLFSYFVRRQSANAFVSPFKQSEQQTKGEQQVALSYLLGLDWTIPRQWQEIRAKEKSLAELRKVASEGTLGDVIESSSVLRTKLTVAENEAQELRERIDNFRVIEQYWDLENEASELTQKLGSLADGNTTDRRLLAQLRQVIQEESDPPIRDVEKLYAEAGAVLSTEVLRRFDDVKEFHESVARNRRLYLEDEIQQVTQRIAEREREQNTIESRRSHVMSILQSYGALEQLRKLQSELNKRETLTENIRQRFTAAQQLESQKTELQMERQRLLLRLRQDHLEQDNRLRNAILAFERNSKALYEEAGNLNIDTTDNGPQFKVTIQGEESKGINNMQIFCFDMMLMMIMGESEYGPRFLVHDSHLFDGVDERQTAKALQVGAENSKNLNFQYIVTLNSDVLPTSYLENFDLEEYVLPVRLTDETESGGLFGIKF